ncbi:MAG: NRDE family protein [Lewinellaceae bacterium]|nr:NRDE family protein [Lewinellaceae bacterium]
MCTVTYIPQGPESFILSSNRDETPARSPERLTRQEEGDHLLIFPRDTSAGGTWIAAETDDRVVCLLNGAFEKHHHRPPYKRSRGIMVLDFFNYPSVSDFAKNYDFDGMEPFTLVLPEKGRLFELRWDEKLVHLRELDARDFHIWSSATLYPGPIREKRVQWFEDWLQNRSDFSLDAIHDLHLHGGEGDSWNDYVMNRNGIVQTVSISHIVKTPNTLDFIYHDLLRGAMRRESAGW